MQLLYLKKRVIETLLERKRKRIIIDSGNSDRSDDSETGASLNDEIKRGRRENIDKDTWLERLEATVEKLMQRSCQAV